MLAIEEKEKSIVLLKPDVLLQEKEDAVVSLFESDDLHVKKRKQVYLTRKDAEAFFSWLRPKTAQFAAEVESVLKGPCEVLLIEHTDKPTVAQVIAKVEYELKWFDDTGSVGEGPPFEKKDIYFSSDLWSSLRDQEFFFPYMQSQSVERTLCIIKPHAIERGVQDVVVDEILKLGLFAYGKKQMEITKDQAEKICADAEDLSGSVASLMSETCPPIFMIVEGVGAVDRLRLLFGPLHPGMAREVAPASIRDKYGTDSCQNVVHCSCSASAARAELALLYPKKSLQMQRTLCIVQPEALDDLYQIIPKFEKAGFTVLRQQQTTLTPVRAEEFLRKEAGAPGFKGLVRFFSSGPMCMICLYRLEAVEVLKQMLGPADTRVAKAKFPLSMRALFGKDIRRKGFHASESVEDAVREVGFFFPEMGQPLPSDEQVTDYLHQKGAVASMDKINIANPDPRGIQIEHTLQQFISRGLMALCQTQPKKHEAVRTLARWLLENNPNAPAVLEPDMIEYAEVVNAYNEHIMTEDGEMTVEMPVGPREPPKQVIEVNIENEVEEEKIAEFTTPPYVVFVTGGPGSGADSVCKLLKEDFRMIHLSIEGLLQEEVKAGTQVGTEIQKYIETGKMVPDDVTLKLLKNAMLKHREVNRFLLEGFPSSVEQAKLFEQDLAEVAFVLNLDCPDEILHERLTAEGVPAASIEKMVETAKNSASAVNGYYQPIGKLRKIKAAGPLDEVYAVAKKNFHCRFLYVLGAPGAPCMEIAERINEQYGYSIINFSDVLLKYSKSSAKDASIAKDAIEKGLPLKASLACPLLLEEVWKCMSMGANNFVICGFPQSMKQMEFLEFRVPGSSRSLLLDFSLSDINDMGIVFPSDEESIAVKDIKIKAFFGEENQELLSKLPGLVKIPCGLSMLNSLVPARPSLANDKRARLVDTIWKAVVPILMPSITVVLAPPCAGAELLSPMLTDLNPNCYGVDVDQLIDKELERKTDLGVRMANMLEKSQAIPLSVNLHLLKSMINQTCSTKAVVFPTYSDGIRSSFVFPSYADQISYVSKEIHIERVFQIAPKSQALPGMQKAYVDRQAKKEESKRMDEDEAIETFDYMVASIDPIAQHFASQGKLEKLEVDGKPSAKDLRSFVDKAMQPQFAVISGLPHSGTAKYAEMVAQHYGVAPAVTVELLEEWSKSNMEKPVTRAEGDKFLNVLQKYANSKGSAVLVLADYPGTADESEKFTSRFGEPKVVAALEVSEDTLKANATAGLSEDDEFNEDEFNAQLEAAKEIHEEFLKFWADFESFTKVNGNGEAAVVVKAVCSGLLPRAYVVVGPSGKANLSNKVAMGLACTGKEPKDKRPMKFTVLDTNVLCQKGEHSEDIEERLVRESFTSSCPDALPIPLWTDIFKEAFAKSPNPLGNFVIVNMPTPSAGVANAPGLRDQFNMLEGICTLVGIVVVQCTEDGYVKWCFDSADEANQYGDTLAKIEEYVEVQYGKDERVTLYKSEVDAKEKDAPEVEVEEDEVPGSAFHEAARKVGFCVASDFFRHRELKMQKL